jgi:Family of unknown function (DUF6328)
MYLQSDGSTQVDQLLTEARIIFPGVQALLGFQLTVALTQAFSELSQEAKLAHAAALWLHRPCGRSADGPCLRPPHRLRRKGRPGFLKIGSAFVVTAPLPLAFGIALDTYVAAGRALQSDAGALMLAAAALAVLLGFWYLLPLWRRLGS